MYCSVLQCVSYKCACQLMFIVLHSCVALMCRVLMCMLTILVVVMCMLLFLKDFFLKKINFDFSRRP